MFCMFIDNKNIDGVGASLDLEDENAETIIFDSSFKNGIALDCGSFKIVSKTYNFSRICIYYCYATNRYNAIDANCGNRECEVNFLTTIKSGPNSQMSSSYYVIYLTGHISYDNNNVSCSHVKEYDNLLLYDKTSTTTNLLFSTMYNNVGCRVLYLSDNMHKFNLIKWNFVSNYPSSIETVLIRHYNAFGTYIECVFKDNQHETLQANTKNSGTNYTTSLSCNNKFSGIPTGCVETINNNHLSEKMCHVSYSHLFAIRK